MLFRSFQEDAGKCGARSAQRCTCVKVLLVDKAATADGGEYLQDDVAVYIGVGGGREGGDDCHPFAYLNDRILEWLTVEGGCAHFARRVWHGAHHLSGRRNPARELCDRHSRQNADKQLVAERV